MDERIQKPRLLRSKALGQYFTDKTIAELLANLALGNHRPSSILDPMAGEGDMLKGAYSVFGDKPRYMGVEVDPQIIEKVTKSSLEHFPWQLIQGNCFSPKVWGNLGNPTFDLVITNPPYVRYQSHREVITIYGLSGLEDIRTALSNVLNQYYSKEDPEYALFANLIQGFSGQSDLAVPAWILCGILTRLGGTLAMVVPESWLTRDYASPISWMLLKLFRLKFVVADASRTWFGEAQVKTNLVVAERIEIVNDPQNYWAKQKYVYAVSREKLTKNEVHNSLKTDTPKPNRRFAEALRDLLITDQDVQVPFPYERRQLADELGIVMGRLSKNKSLSRRFLTVVQTKEYRDRPYIPHQMQSVLKRRFKKLQILEDLGVEVGQGLRTGANEFFYMKIISKNDDTNVVLVQTSREFGSKLIEVPKVIIKPAIRFQSDLSDTQTGIGQEEASWALLDLGGYALSKDVEVAKEVNPTLPLKELDETWPQVAQYVSQAGKSNIPKLSAVKTNENIVKGRFWYTLPPLGIRHRPDIFLARINGKIPQARLNFARSTIVDANFSTVWLRESARINVFGLLALFSSVTLAAAMEMTGSVLGGGALKLEATHIRRLPVPALSDNQLQALSEIGRKLASKEKVELQIIDEVLIGKSGVNNYLKKMNSILWDHLEDRSSGARYG